MQVLQKNTVRGLTGVCAAALAIAFAGQAQGETFDRGALEDLFEEPVTTSATGAPQRATDAPVNMIIISQEEIRRSGAIDLPGVLERLANVDVMRTSRGQADVAIRGYNATLSPRLLVLLNGRQVYLDHYGTTNWDLIPVQMSEIRQIEVVTGPNTALFGFNAVGGVVNIITFDVLHDDIDEALVRVGTDGYASASAVLTGRLSERLGARLSFGGFNAEALDGDHAASQAFLAAPSIDPIARSVAFNGAYQLSPSMTAEMEATWSRNERTDRYGEAVFHSFWETNSVKLGLSAETPLGLVNAQVFSNHLDVGFENRISVASLALIAKPAPAHTIRIAGEMRHNWLDQGASELDYNVYAASAMWHWQATPALAITSAARLEELELDRSGAFIANFPFSDSDFDRAFDEWSYNFGGVYRLSEGDAIRLSAARGVGSPSLLDYGYEAVFPVPPATTIVVAGDPYLTPTIVTNVELGWDHDIAAIDGRLRAALFWQQNDDLRTFAARTEILSFAPFVMALFPANTGSSEMRGLELSVEGQSGPWHWDARYSWRDVDDSLTVSPLINQAAADRTTPEHVATASATWVGERLEIGADARLLSETEQYGQGAALVGLYEVDAHVLVNARAAWRASESVTIELSGRNLLEDRTQSAGLTPVERSVYVTLRTGF
jgi:outer membrane receptor for ferrienterochelin and colicins